MGLLIGRRSEGGTSSQRRPAPLRGKATDVSVPRRPALLQAGGVVGPLVVAGDESIRSLCASRLYGRKVPQVLRRPWAGLPAVEHEEAPHVGLGVRCQLIRSWRGPLPSLRGAANLSTTETDSPVRRWTSTAMPSPRVSRTRSTAVCPLGAGRGDAMAPDEQGHLGTADVPGLDQEMVLVAEVGPASATVLGRAVAFRRRHPASTRCVAVGVAPVSTRAHVSMSCRRRCTVAEGDVAGLVASRSLSVNELTASLCGVDPLNTTGASWSSAWRRRCQQCQTCFVGDDVAPDLDLEIVRSQFGRPAGDGPPG